MIDFIKGLFGKRELTMWEKWQHNHNKVNKLQHLRENEIRIRLGMKTREFI